jgi:L-tartrate/succinate antiporter
MSMKQYLKAIIPLLAGVIIWLIPVPEGLSVNAWHYFAIFIAVILGLVLEPLPAAVCGLLGVGLMASLALVPPSPPPMPGAKPAAVAAKAPEAPKPPEAAAAKAEPAKPPETAKPAEAPKPTEQAKPADAAKAEADKAAPAKAGPAKPAAKKPTANDQIKWALSGFANATVWLIFAAFIFAQGYEKTGLGKRIALMLMRALGKSTLGLSYAVALSDLVLAPFLPSNTARSGGTIYPIIKNIPPLFDSTPDHEPRKIGSFLMWSALAADCVTTTAFLTAFAPNLLAVSLVQKIAGIGISWTEWFVAMLPVCAVLFVITPYLVYLIYPPTLKKSPEAPVWAAKELAALGPVSRRELTMVALAVGALLLWIFGGPWINATTVALAAVGLMIPTKVVSWDDILGNKPAWNILFWYGMLMAVADGLNRVGFLGWFCVSLSHSLNGLGIMLVMILLLVVFWYASFFFASITALTTALFPPFLVAAMLVPGLPVKMFIMLMCGSLGLRGILTPYSVAPATIYYGSGYLPAADHWRLGFIFSTFFLVVFLIIGIPYMSFLYGA